MKQPTYSKEKSPLSAACYPYLFALREGGAIESNLLDYSLLLLQLTCTEVIKSPKSMKVKALLVEQKPFTFFKKEQI